MSIYVVEREREWDWLRDGAHRWLRESFGRQVFQVFPPSVEVLLRDPNEHDGEWPAFITLPHETVEHEGRAVPLFEGDVERREWEARRRERRARP